MAPHNKRHEKRATWRHVAARKKRLSRADEKLESFLKKYSQKEKKRNALRATREPRNELLLGSTSSLDSTGVSDYPGQLSENLEHPSNPVGTRNMSNGHPSEDLERPSNPIDTRSRSISRETRQFTGHITNTVTSRDLDQSASNQGATSSRQGYTQVREEMPSTSTGRASRGITRVLYTPIHRFSPYHDPITNRQLFGRLNQNPSPRADQAQQKESQNPSIALNEQESTDEDEEEPRTKKARATTDENSNPTQDSNSYDGFQSYMNSLGATGYTIGRGHYGGSSGGVATQSRAPLLDLTQQPNRRKRGHAPAVQRRVPRDNLTIEERIQQMNLESGNNNSSPSDREAENAWSEDTSSEDSSTNTSFSEITDDENQEN
ncbi:Protein CBG27626 [Caenorhabditis briggsae]|uniref:Protein CBG27626 n=1 Tax=Caenorhabditis briggsae TaxID=6238 RepID=B6IJ71_CAEBR|nr:Protein CBG27626 [Caenorhabditis briggsae]CAR99905.1 Protein CBG27626 [Caenorhabditis briggsae]